MDLFTLAMAKSHIDSASSGSSDGSSLTSEQIEILEQANKWLEGLDTATIANIAELTSFKSETETALNSKVTAVDGKSLSSNDFTNDAVAKLNSLSNYDDSELRTLISEVQTTADSKVTAVSGKGLSTNDYTTTEKNKLASLSNYNDTEIRELLDEKDNKTVILTIAESEGVLTLNDNTEVRGGEFAAYEWTLPETISSDYLSSVIFTSGTTATNLTLPDNIIWTGDDCIEGEPFSPIASKRYSVIFEYDDVNVIATVRGYSI